MRDGELGRVVRVALRKGYAKRTAVERVNNRIDQVHGFERHFIRGKTKVGLRLSLATLVMLGTAAA